jgi:hypothetical protein
LTLELDKIDPEFKQIVDEYVYFLEGVEGRRADLRGRIELFTNPRNPLTATNLTPIKIEAVVDMMEDGTAFMELAPMKDWALKLCQGYLSKEGWAVNSAKESFQTQNEQKRGAFQIIQGAIQGAREGAQGGGSSE